jgi:hypothetical protein
MVLLFNSLLPSAFHLLLSSIFGLSLRLRALDVRLSERADTRPALLTNVAPPFLFLDPLSFFARTHRRGAALHWAMLILYFGYYSGR